MVNKLWEGLIFGWTIPVICNKKLYKMWHNIWSDVVCVFTLENELIGTFQDACLIISVNLSVSLNHYKLTCYHSETLDVHMTESFQRCRKSMVCKYCTYSFCDSFPKSLSVRMACIYCSSLFVDLYILLKCNVAKQSARFWLVKTGPVAFEVLRRV